MTADDLKEPTEDETKALRNRARSHRLHLVDVTINGRFVPKAVTFERISLVLDDGAVEELRVFLAKWMATP